VIGNWDPRSWRLWVLGTWKVLRFLVPSKVLGFRCFKWLKLQIMMVVLKLPLNFKVKAFFSNYNAYNNAKIHIDPSFVTSYSNIPIQRNLGKAPIFCPWIQGKLILIMIDFENLSNPSPHLLIQHRLLLWTYIKESSKNYDARWKWQDSWVTQFSWVELEMVNGFFCLYEVCCLQSHH
jgi:hypothetical protein